MGSGDYTIQIKLTATDTVYTLIRQTAEDRQHSYEARAKYEQALKDGTIKPGESLTTYSKPRESDAFPRGYKINMMTTRDIDGKRIDNKMIEGKIVVLNFWFVGCPPCKAEIPELNKLALDNANNPDIIFLAVALDKSYLVKDFIKNNPFAYRQITDAARFCEAYGIKGYPTNVVIDKKGIIQFSSIGYGPGSLAWLKKTLDELKTEKLPE